MAARYLAPVQNLKIYVEAFLGFSHRFSPDGLNNNLLSQGHVLENGSYCGHSGQNVYSKDREAGVTAFSAWFQVMGQVAIALS